MGVSSFPAKTQQRSGSGRGDPNPAATGERKGVGAWFAGAGEAVSRIFRRSSDGGERGARGAAASGGGFDFRRYGPIILFVGLGIAVLAGVVFFAGNVVRNVVGGPVAVVEQPFDGSADRAAPRSTASEDSAVIQEEKQGVAEGAKQAPGAGAAVEASNDWILPLTRRQISRYYPDRALQKGIQGSATLRCSFADGRRADCTVVRERPDGWRFGAAARRLSRQFKPTAEAISGEPFTVTVRFRLEQ